MGAAPPPTDPTARRARGSAPDHQVVIVGSGFSGIGAAVALRRLGIEDFLMLEREERPGGTWVQHDYPGLEVDMPFFIYSFPFEPKADWARLYPTGAEMREYTESCLDKYDLHRRLRCGRGVARAAYDAGANVWRIELEDGEALSTRYLVNATGLLVVPKRPELPGLDGFAGRVLHTSRWDHGWDPSGQRVAVIGTGATAIQLIPELAAKVERLDVYQRTPIWLLAKPNPELGPGWQRALRAAPFLQAWMRWLTNLFVEIALGMGMVRYTSFPWIFDWVERKLVARIRSEVRDPATREKLIPRYSFFCKRPSFSNAFYATFNRPGVELVTEPIARVTPRGIATADGRERAVDAIVCATGYHVFDRLCTPGYAVIGRDGVELGEFWERHRFQAYEGASVPGFPNLFLMMGPYSAAGASYFTMIDTQSRHLTRCIREAERRGTGYAEVRRAAHERDFAKVNRRRRTMVLFGGNCADSHSYYFDAHGDAPGLRPVTGFEHWLRSRFFRLSDYAFEPPRPPAGAAR